MKKLRRAIAGYLAGTALSYCLCGLIWLLRLTMRITVVGEEIMPALVRRGEGFVSAFWHGRMLLFPFLKPGSPTYVLISVHRDGEMIASAVRHFGFRLVRGSSSKGGRAALREMVRLLKEDNNLAITPDGPRGPAETAKPGVAQVAKIAGKAVVPIAFAASRATRMRSWDRFLVPRPFSRGVFVVGEPLYCAMEETVEAFRQRIEAALQAATARADAMFPS
jgi:lysophospholipid acyltransferase (LPLAT)-like uncharacterized protein